MVLNRWSNMDINRKLYIYDNILVHFNIINLYDRLFIRIGGASGGTALDSTSYSTDGLTMYPSSNGFGLKNDSVVELLNNKIYLNKL